MARATKYLLVDGTIVAGRANARRVSRDELAQSVSSSQLALSYFLGTARHETNFAVNEVDYGDSAGTTYGPFQVTDAEAKRYGSTGLQCAQSLDEASRVFMRLALDNALQVAAYASLSIYNPPGEFYAYLALAHNQGLKAAHKTIVTYGFDWARYVERNQGAHPEWISYYGDCIPSGGLDLSVSDSPSETTPDDGVQTDGGNGDQTDGGNGDQTDGDQTDGGNGVSGAGLAAVAVLVLGGLLVR
jgi:hypothetical protein